MLCFSTSQKTEFLQLFHMLCSAFCGVNSCSVNIGMTEYIGESYNIFLQGVISSCEKVAEIMRKNLSFATPALSHSSFNILHILDLSRGVPVLVTKTLPLLIPCFDAYWFSMIHSFLGRKACLIFPLQLMVACPRFIAFNQAFLILNDPFLARNFSAVWTPF